MSENANQLAKLEVFSNTINSRRNVIQKYGPFGHAPPDIFLDPNTAIAEAYEAIRHLLKPIANRRLFPRPPVMRRSAIAADTAYEGMAKWLTESEICPEDAMGLETSEFRKLATCMNAETEELQLRRKSRHNRERDGLEGMTAEDWNAVELFRLFLHLGSTNAPERLRRRLAQWEVGKEVGMSQPTVSRTLDHPLVNGLLDAYNNSFVSDDSSLFLAELGKKRNNGRVMDDFSDFFDDLNELD